MSKAGRGTELSRDRQTPTILTNARCFQLALPVWVRGIIQPQGPPYLVHREYNEDQHGHEGNTHTLVHFSRKALFARVRLSTVVFGATGVPPVAEASGGPATGRRFGRVQRVRERPETAVSFPRALEVALPASSPVPLLGSLMVTSCRCPVAPCYCCRGHGRLCGWLRPRWRCEP